ncbi:MAG: hypothetical protein MSQ05_02060 [Akkermansia sp.]|nr:hypothetical protein [Akkermansia sp.]
MLTRLLSSAWVPGALASCFPLVSAAPSDQSLVVPGKSGFICFGQPFPPESVAPAAEEEKPVSPEEAKTGYEAFLERLNDQVKSNSYDLCPAMTIIYNSLGDELQFLPWMERAAKEGNPAAIQFVSNRRVRFLTPKTALGPEAKDCFEQMKKAAESGYDPAVISLYLFMSEGLGTRADAAAAGKFIFSACKSGSFAPRHRWLIASGRLNSFEDRNLPEVRSEVERGNDLVMYELSRLATKAEDQLQWLRAAAEKGNGRALYDLSIVFSTSKPEIGYNFLQESVKRHNPNALFTLGLLLVSPQDKLSVHVKQLNLQQDIPNGLRLIKIASMLREERACYWLGRAYFNGDCSLPKDPERAYQHFFNGMICESIPAAAAAGYMMARGIGCKQDTRQGIALLVEASNRRNARAMTLLAKLQCEGVGGIPRSALEASFTLQDAATAGDKEAFLYLATLYALGGPDLKRDSTRAEHYLKLAKQDLGEEEAQRRYDSIIAAGTWEPTP